MRDHVVERAILVHPLQISGVELHLSFGWEESSLRCASRAEVSGACLAQNVTHAVDGRAFGEDQNVIDELSVHHDGWEIADDDSTPAVCGLLEGALLPFIEASLKANRNREG